MSATPIYQSMTEPISLDLDTARVRRSDPPASHIAATRSQRGLSKLRLAVLRMVEEYPHGITGAAANRLYVHHAEAEGFPVCHFDSPRKRIAELADDGLVDVIAHNHGTLEAVYSISPDGRAEVRRNRS